MTSRPLSFFDTYSQISHKKMSLILDVTTPPPQKTGGILFLNYCLSDINAPVQSNQASARQRVIIRDSRVFNDSW